MGAGGDPVVSIEQHVSVGQAAALLSLKPRLLREHIARGDLPAVRIGREYRIAVSQLQEWLHARSTTRIAS